MLDQEPSLITNGVAGILSLAAILGFSLTPEIAATLVLALQGIAALIVRKNVYSRATVRRIVKK